MLVQHGQPVECRERTPDRHGIDTPHDEEDEARASIRCRPAIEVERRRTRCCTPLTLTGVDESTTFRMPLT